jgi:hypothetical protein
VRWVLVVFNDGDGGCFGKLLFLHVCHALL